MIEAWAELNASDYIAGISPFPVDEKLQKCTDSYMHHISVCNHTMFEWTRNTEIGYAMTFII